MTVYLIGDSIRLAAEPYVRAALPGITIVAPEENCRSSHDVLRHIEQWTEGAAKGDTVHINCGLHDIRRDAEKNALLTDLTDYCANLVRIFNYLQQTGVRVIWAQSTPFLENVHNTVKTSRRYLTDLTVYNRASGNLAAQYGFAINPLYGLLQGQHLPDMMLGDGLHFNEQGSAFIGNAVAQAIMREMEIGGKAV